MKISIIIPTWNTASITLRCINSIKSSLPTKSYEIIIIDNHSTDNTIKLISHQKDVVLIKNQKNLGYAKACNQGATIATGDFLFFLNSDMCLVDASLIDMAQFLVNSQIGAVGPRFLNPNLTPQASVFPPQTPLNAIKEYWLNQPHAYSKYLISSSHPVSVNAISGGAILLTTPFFHQLGAWNEKYHFYYEDMDLCRRILSLNKQIYYYPGCTVIHDHGASGTTLASTENQWRRLIPSSKIYHGLIRHYIINFILWSGQKFHRFF